MKTIVEISGANYASHGNITINLAKKARENGFNVYTLFSDSRQARKHLKKDQILFGFWIERIISERLSILTGLRDSFNIIGTYQLINKIKSSKPDLIHLHLLHDNFINLSLLINYLKKSNIPVVWTFHDVWALTGQCPAFEMVNCNKWIDGCHNCPQYKNEPKSLLFDTSRLMWNRKRKLFTDFNNLTIATPSKWTEKMVSLSYFKNNEIHTIYNGIDLSVFNPKTVDRSKYNLPDKHIILGVASYWEKRKGLDIFIELAKRLNNDYQIVLVGTNDQIDKLLPENIISIHKTSDQSELAELYSLAEVFVNPTREDVFGLVNVESLACGTPVIVFKTGGCPEIINDTCGYVIEKDDIESLTEKIKYICSNHPFAKKACVKQASKFDMNNTYQDYIDLYKNKTNLL